MLRIDVNPFSPTVTEDVATGEWTGFEVDLLKQILVPEGYTIRFRRVDTFEHMFAGLKNDEADLAAAAISMRLDRQNELDFTYSTLDSHLSVLAPGKEVRSWFGAVRVRVMLVLPTLIFALTFTALAAGLLWCFLRGSAFG